MNQSRQSKLVFTLFFLLVTTVLIAQETGNTPLSLEDAVSNAIANNHQIKSSKFDVQAAQTDVNQIISYRLPQVEANLVGAVTNLPLNAFGSSLQQGSIEQTDFIPSALNNPSATTNLQSQIALYQPLMNLDVKAMKKAMEAKAAAYDQVNERTEQMITSYVAQTYLQLQLSHSMLDVLKSAKTTAEASLELTQNNIDAGYLQKVDLLSVQLRLSEIEYQIFEVESNIIYASDQLSYLMGADIGTVYQPTAQLEDIDKSQLLLEDLPTNRSDFNAINYQIEAKNHMLSAQKKTNLPRINLFGTYEVNNPLDFQEAQHGYMVGVQTSWKIFDGLKNKNDVQKTKIEIEQAINNLNQTIHQNELELQKAKRQLLQARNRIEMSKIAIEQAKESLRIKLNRYEEGLEKTTDILYAETTLAQKEMSYVEAIYDYHQAFTQINNLLETSNN